MVGLRKGPQEYHSTPAERLSADVMDESVGLLVVVLTGSPGSAVVQALERARGVDEVAAGKDVGLADDVLAVITTVIIHGIFHGRHVELLVRGCG